MTKFSLLCLSILLFSCNSSAQKKNNEKAIEYKVIKTEAEWKAQLTDNEFYVIRKSGTERAFSSPLNKNYQEGIYACKACEHKFDSGTGWPSFDREIKGNVEFSSDNLLGYTRTEEHCATCGGHLGHVFNDGPSDTTGERHCINGVSLKFIPKE
jgi:peptide-methionine (R)-S-oxide reductase